MVTHGVQIGGGEGLFHFLPLDGIGIFCILEPTALVSEFPSNSGINRGQRIWRRIATKRAVYEDDVSVFSLIGLDRSSHHFNLRRRRCVSFNRILH